MRNESRNLAYGNQRLSATNGDRFRRPYRHPYSGNYGGRYPYGTALWISPYPGPYAEGWLDPWFYDYPDDGDGDGYNSVAPAYGYNDPNEADPGPYADNGAYPEQGAEGYYEQRPSRRSYGGFADSSGSPPLTQEAVTLVYKDGRPPEQIHNYILSQTQLTVLDGHARNIPVDQLDMAATESANRNSGVRFRLPTASN